MNLQMGLRDWLALLLLSLLWGGSFFFIALAVGQFPPLTLVLLRVALAAALLLVYARLTCGGLPRSGRVWGAFALMGLLNNMLPFSLIVWGQTQIAAGLAAILNAATPIFSVLLAHALTQDERLSTHRLLGVLLVFIGVVVVLGGSLQADADGLLPQLAVLGAAMSYAFAGIFGKRFAVLGVKPVQAAAGQLTASSVLVLPLVLAIEQPWTLAPPGAGAWMSVLALALFSTALAYVIYFRLLASAGATNLLLVTLLIPVSAILLGALFLGEQLALSHYLGVIVIASGLLLLDGRVIRLVLRRS